LSLRQDEVIRRLPENGFNISKTAREVGYTEQGSRSGTLYASLRKKIAKAFNPEQLKADLLKAEKDFTKAEDNSNRARMLELRAKILGLTKEQSNTQVSVFTGDMIKDLPALDITENAPKHGVDKNDNTQAQSIVNY
jgi:hypothetical protein